MFCLVEILLFHVQDKGNGSLLKAEDRLRHALIPKYQMIFTQIGHLENGVKFLVDMRADILVSQNPLSYDDIPL